MPRGVYERKTKDRAPSKARKRSGGGSDLLKKLRTERTKAEDRVVAFGTAIEALEALDER